VCKWKIIVAGTLLLIWRLKKSEGGAGGHGNVVITPGSSAESRQAAVFGIFGKAYKSIAQHQEKSYFVHIQAPILLIFMLLAERRFGS